MSAALPLVVLGTDEVPVAQLAAALDVRPELVPTFPAGGPGWSWAAQLDTWRDDALTRAPADAVVVAAWAPLVPAMAVATVGLDDWVDRAEAPLAVWASAMGVAARRCADGGTIVAVTERPSPLDAAGRGVEGAVADGVEALVRSLARSEGPRGVRVNLVTTPTRLAPDAPVAPAPSLASFPGSIDTEVVGAVRLLLGAGADGLTGTVLHADCGRSWR